jgi:hypothetical protein
MSARETETKVKIKEPTPSDRMDRLERRAKVVRSRLFRAVDVLDSRRHKVVEMTDTARRIVAGPVVRGAALAVLGIAMLFGASAIAFGLALKAKRHRKLSYRAAQHVKKAIVRLDLIPQPTLARRVADKLVLTLVSIVASEIARRAKTLSVASEISEIQVTNGGRL